MYTYRVTQKSLGTQRHSFSIDCQVTFEPPCAYINNSHTVG